MKDKINTYFAVLLVTIAGASATWIIVNVAVTDTLAATVNGSEVQYVMLQKSILK